MSASAGSKGGADWALILFLCPWREVGRGVFRQELRLLVPMADRDSASRAVDEWKGKMIALAVERLELPSEILPCGLAYGRAPLQRIDVDAELQTAIDDLARPRRVLDPVLGELVLDRRLSWFHGERRTLKGTYGVDVETCAPDDEARVAAAVARGGVIVERLEANLASILDAIVDAKLGLYNAKWREEGPPLSPVAFRSRLSLSSVVVGDARTTAYVDCDNLFSDHVIEVRMAPDGGISEICLAG